MTATIPGAPVGTTAAGPSASTPRDGSGYVSAARRRAMPRFDDVAKAAAEQYGVCVRPFVVQRTDTTTGAQDYVPVPCGCTLSSLCPPCAAKSRALRMTQCREGWHLTEEPRADRDEPTEQQKTLLARLADLTTQYRTALEAGQPSAALDELRTRISAVDRQLREAGMSGRGPNPDPTHGKPVRHRSTRRRQDAPDLPRKQMTKTTLGREYAGGRFRPSMFITLTLPGYGAVRDGAPVRPDRYDYRQAARDAVFFSALVDRWIQNLRRCAGWDVQYFATIEPQKRGAPHIHLAIRGSLPRTIIRQVTEATYHQVWWPRFDQPVYGGTRVPVWDYDRRTFIDPDTRAPLTRWDEALDAPTDEDATPAHVARFGTQTHIRGVLAGTPEAERHISYLSKYLTKSIGDITTADTPARRAHQDRLHAELGKTPCSPACGLWLLYGIVPKRATSRTTPHCRGRAHRRDTLGLPGRRVLVSRRWSNKTLPDHRADRGEFVRQLLAEVGITKPAPDPDRYRWEQVRPGNTRVPPRRHLLLAAIAQRRAWRAEYDRAMLAAHARAQQAATVTPETSATPPTPPADHRSNP